VLSVPGWLSSLRELIAEASPLRRFTFALLVLLPLAALAAAYLWFTPSVYRVLYTQLSDRSGGEVIAALEQLDIPYRLSVADGSIEVPADRLHAARYRLAARGLPRSDADAQDEAERAPRFGASSLQEQQRFQRTLETDLSRSIQSLEAVELARVHLALPRVSPFLRDAPPATAAVLVRLRPGAHLQPEQVTTIQTLVAASVPRMKRSEVQVLDPSGMLLGEAVPEPVQSQRLALEQDLVRRVLAVLTPWLGEDRVSVQVTATLEDSETRQTVERVQNVVVAGAAHPLEKSVRTTREPEGRIHRIQAIVILGYDASAEELQRAGQLAQQALGLEPARGDSVNVYALPTAAPSAAAENWAPAEVLENAPPAASAPVSVPRVAPASTSASARAWQALPPWALAAVAALLALLVMMIWRRRGPLPEAPAAEVDFDAELDTTRNQVLANPRVTADVVRLWMRA
jgi:flagellar M-ring protein FliF